MVLTDTDALKNGQTSEKVGILKYDHYYTLAMNMQFLINETSDDDIQGPNRTTNLPRMALNG